MNIYQQFRGQQKHTGKFHRPGLTRDDPPYALDFRQSKRAFMEHTTLQEWLDNPEFIQGRMENCDELITYQLTK